MKKKKRKSDVVSFDCMTFQQADHNLVLFCASAKALWGITQVNQRQEDGDKGYQRAVSAARADKIAKFIDEENVIPLSVLISFKSAKLKSNDTKLEVVNKKDSGWIIDGQHRLAGGNESNNDIILPVVAFIGLEITEQIKCFVTINKEQRGVPSSLYLELLKSIPGTRNSTEEAKERTVDIAHILKKDEKSPFYGRIISTSSPRKGELSMTNFVRKVHTLIKTNGRLATFNDEERCGIINNYYLGLKNAFPDEYERVDSIFFKTIGFGALIGMLPAFLDLTLGEFGKFQTSNTSAVFKRIEHFDFSAWRGLSGSGAETVASEELRGELMHYGKSTKKYGSIQL